MDGFHLKDYNPTAETIALVPASYCFVHSLEQPSGVDESELRNLVEFTLEALSPFPLDQLAWGYMNLAGDSHLLIHAAYKPRLNHEGLAPFPDSGYVLPVFASIFPLKIQAPTVFFLHYKNELNALFAEPELATPVRVDTLTIVGDPDDPEVLFRARNTLIDTLSAGERYYIDQGINTLEYGEVYADGTAGFHFTRRDTRESSPEVLSINHNTHTSSIWNADLRDTAFIQSEIRRRRLGHRMWSAFKGAGIAASLLLCAQLVYFAWSSAYEKREVRIQETAIAVDSVKQKHETLMTLRTFSTEALKPFTILGEIDKYRPAEIWFRGVSGSSGNVMRIQGIAPSQSRLNAYTDALKKTSRFDYVNVPNFDTRSGQVNFTLELKYAPKDNAPFEGIASTSETSAPQ